MVLFIIIAVFFLSMYDRVNDNNLHEFRLMFSTIVKYINFFNFAASNKEFNSTVAFCLSHLSFEVAACPMNRSNSPKKY